MVIRIVLVSRACRDCTITQGNLRRNHHMTRSFIGRNRSQLESDKKRGYTASEK